MADSRSRPAPRSPVAVRTPPAADRALPSRRPCPAPPWALDVPRRGPSVVDERRCRGRVRGARRLRVKGCGLTDTRVGVRRLRVKAGAVADVRGWRASSA